MATEVGSAYVSIIPSAKGFGRKLDGSIGGQVDKSATTSGRRFGGRFSSAVGVGLKGIGVGLAAGLVGTGALLRGSITAASDLGETTSKVGQILGTQALPGLQKFAKQAATSMGQSQQSALDAVATFATFGKAAGLHGQGLASFSTKLTTLSSDMASFSNTSPQDAIEAIGSALRGESEPIRRYGVLLDEATLKAEAMSLGLVKAAKDPAKIAVAQTRAVLAQHKYNAALKEFGKGSDKTLAAEASLLSAKSTLAKATEGSIQPLTQQQKVLAAESSIFKQTGDAQGDFIRTSGGLANQQRVLSAQFQNTKASLGQAFLPTAVTVVKFLNSKMIPALFKFGGFLKADVLPVLKRVGGFIRSTVVPPLVRFARVVKTVAGTLVGDFISGLHGARDNMGGMQGFAQKLGEVVLRFGIFLKTRAIPALVQFGGFIKTKVLPSVRTFGSFLASKIGPALQRFGGFIKTTVIPALVRFGGFVKTTIVPALQRFGLFLTTAVLPALLRLGTFLKVQFTPTFNALSIAITTKILPALQGLWARLQAVAPTVLRVALVIGKIVGVLILVALVIVAKVLPVLIKLAAIILVVVFKAIGKVMGIMAAFARAVIRIGTVVGRVAVAVGTGIVRIVRFFVNLPNRVLAAVGSFATILFQAGRDLITGLVNGIKSLITAPVDAVKGVAGKIKHGFTSVLGIGSPSKVFAGFGLNINQGLVEGLKKSDNLAQRGAAGTARAVTTGFKAGTAANPRQADVRHGAGGAGTTNITVNNPKPEPASESVPKALRRKLHRQGVPAT